jgi:hypothetical protein
MTTVEPDSGMATEDKDNGMTIDGFRRLCRRFSAIVGSVSSLPVSGGL